jgi:quercetin 2,3-dioxygenase
MMTEPAFAWFAATSGGSVVISHVWVPPGRRKTLPVEPSVTPFAYIFEGDGTFSQASQPLGVLTEKAGEGGETLARERTGNRSLVLFGSGSEVTVQAGENGIRFLLVSGKPIEEPGTGRS